MENINTDEAAEDLKKLRKDEIGDFLNLTQKEMNSTRKDILLSNLLLLINQNDVLLKEVYKKFSRNFGLHPCKVEEYLNITKTERLRWTKETKLKVVGYSSFRKWGKDLQYPLYDAYQIKMISQADINNWRLRHKNKLKKARLTALKKAMETRNKNRAIQREFYECTWKKLLKEWYLIDGQLGASLQLAYWTMWISRWAKEYQIKAKTARIKTDDYLDKKEQFYSMKNEAIKRLILSPYSRISFYQPLKADKITYLEFCPQHYEQWMLEREFGYISKWDFYYTFEKNIHKCKSCIVDTEEDYYSLYYISVGHLEYSFSFHTPHPIGTLYLPSKESLPQISHEEQEGMFRFGRALFDDEKVIFIEKEVIKHFNEAIIKFDLYFSETKDQMTGTNTVYIG